MTELNTWRIWLPFPPSTNNLFPHRIIKGQIRRVPSKGYTKWRRDAHVYLLAAKLPRFSEPIVLKLELTPPCARRRDASNYVKAVEDALVDMRVLRGDDQRYVKAVAVWWHDPSPSSGVQVIIRLARNVTPDLNAAERRELDRIKQAGVLVLRANHHPSQAQQALAEKGLIEPVPGLLEGKPQGWRIPA